MVYIHDIFFKPQRLFSVVFWGLGFSPTCKKICFFGFGLTNSLLATFVSSVFTASLSLVLLPFPHLSQLSNFPLYYYAFCTGCSSERPLCLIDIFHYNLHLIRQLTYVFCVCLIAINTLVFCLQFLCFSSKAF